MIEDTESNELSEQGINDSLPESEDLVGQSLPPVDRGKDAWLVLVGTFVIEGLVWGFPFTSGVFQEYYSNNGQFDDNPAGVTMIGTVTLGVLYLSSPLCLFALRQWPRYRRRSIILGCLISSLALVAASFATRVWQLVLTQGFLYAIGACMMSYPTMLFVNEWFVHRKGLAFGIAWASTGCSGVTAPLFISWSLSHFSFRTTLRIWAVASTILLCPVLPFMKPRVPPSTVSASKIPNMKFVICRPFLPLQLCSIMESLGYFLPSLYLPLYARSLGFSNEIATASVVLLNGGAFFGSVVIGFLVDQWDVTTVMLFSTVGATASVVFLWGFSGLAAILCTFSCLYGFFAGSFSSIWPGIMRETTAKHYSAEPGLVYALLVAGRGVGGVLSGPLSEALLTAPPLTNVISYGYGSKYGILIVFTGVTTMLGGIGFFGRRLGWV
ncbi:hypothetical protein DTO166G4_267 [Paecilomyces variotii]|uniref:Putative MFS monocarboxylate transporter n=1 Tax=Byssochlamys spectabilis TaxID=264951 RepID=A0A443HV68_BYSSP|nr:putative MFS monocarboxylate transporter [Paecilomyces variotii]KAJ9202047.1 hypothetical protein DTO032I3_3778 [Paecilomyces variotii]KAJ9217876.1 hypothetical protein DTO166G4_267 [Paecilomyces variotii]KAJ9226015.1 hypothetical protein DTO169C6_1654 [Paecilomyces variotii]KAJ9240572.1 hypothetical protein DTO169E5_3904 [Paecilomyces variotii]KAJ9241130.1 hypothetical protein DTO166G5_1292 [Paecilomyces variotii]